MFNRIAFTLGGLFLGGVTPLLTGGVIASVQGVSFRNFLWALFHLNGLYNSAFQLGIAINIGIFFLLMRKEGTIFFGRGWLIATILMALWTAIIEFHWHL